MPSSYQPVRRTTDQICRPADSLQSIEEEGGSKAHKSALAPSQKPRRGLAGNRYEHGQIFANRLMDR